MDRQYQQNVIVPPPPQLAIPYGKFFSIDERYYDPVESQPIDSFSKGLELKAHGNNVNYQPTDFVKHSPSLALDQGSLKVNYGSYIFQQRTGFDANHGRFEKTEPVQVPEFV